MSNSFSSEARNDRKSTDHENYRRAAHCFIYSYSDEIVLQKYKVRANVLMVMRFDGKMGFPGGYVDKNENIIDGLNRELREEINLDDKFNVIADNYLSSDTDHSKQISCYLYYLKLSYEEYCQMEKRIIDAKEYGNETLGLIRVPLYIAKHNGGFPAFLRNEFIGNAKDQLLYALEHLQIMSKDEISNSIQLSQN